MPRNLRVYVFGLTLFVLPACDRGQWPMRTSQPGKQATPTVPVSTKTPDIGRPLYASVPLQAPPSAGPGEVSTPIDPVVVHDCQLMVISKEDVPSRRNGVLLYIGTPAETNETVPADRLVMVHIGGKDVRIRRLHEGDVVKPGQVLAQIDDRVQQDDLAIKIGRVKAAKADLVASEKTRDELKWRYDQETRAANSGVPGVTSLQDLRGTKLSYERLVEETISKKEAVHLAELERDQAQTVVRMYQIRSTIGGIVKTIHRQPGEAVKQFDTLVTIQNLGHLRADGLMDGQYVGRVHLGMKVVVEPVNAHGPEQTCIGHLQDVTAVAVTRAPALNVVSASEDGTVRIWDRGPRHPRLVLQHPCGVRAVACTPTGAVGNWCLSGGKDGIARLWDLEGDGKSVLRELTGGHQGAITCVAFSPEGKQCATGGDDCVICLWDTNTGKLLYRLSVCHRGPITSLQFTPQGTLVSAGQDNTLRIWSLGQNGGRLEKTFDHRTGDVRQLGVSADGREVAFDQGKELRLLTLPNGLSDGVLQNAKATNFATLALFSPDARLMLTAGAEEGCLQVWRLPDGRTRGHEICQLVPPERSSARCAAFAPDGSFAVSATQDRIHIWSLTAMGNAEQERTAEITLVEKAMDSAAGQVRIRADLPNPDGKLMPGANVTVVVYPER